MGSWIRIKRSNGEYYSFPDPTTERAANATWKARYAVSELTNDDGFALAEMAESLHHILTHPAGTESIIKQVREVRRAWREINKEKIDAQTSED